MPLILIGKSARDNFVTVIGAEPYYVFLIEILNVFFAAGARGRRVCEVVGNGDAVMRRSNLSSADSGDILLSNSPLITSIVVEVSASALDFLSALTN